MSSQADTEGQRSERQQRESRQGPPSFSLLQRDLDADTRVIAVGGELDLATAPNLGRLLDDALEAGARMVVDLTETVFVDSTALSVLLDAGRRLGAAGGGDGGAGNTGGGVEDGIGEPRLAIVCTRPNVLRIFEFSGLDGAFAIFATLDDALAYARRGRTAPCAG